MKWEKIISVISCAQIKTDHGCHEGTDVILTHTNPKKLFLKAHEKQLMMCNVEP